MKAGEDKAYLIKLCKEFRRKSRDKSQIRLLGFEFESVNSPVAADNNRDRIWKQKAS